MYSLVPPGLFLALPNGKQLDGTPSLSLIDTYSNTYRHIYRPSILTGSQMLTYIHTHSHIHGCRDSCLSYSLYEAVSLHRPLAPASIPLFKYRAHNSTPKRDLGLLVLFLMCSLNPSLWFSPRNLNEFSTRLFNIFNWASSVISLSVSPVVVPSAHQQIPF